MQNLFNSEEEVCTSRVFFHKKPLKEETSEEDESSSSNVNENQGNNTQYTIAYTFEIAIKNCKKMERSYICLNIGLRIV